MIAYEDKQIESARVLLELIELRGYENCKNVVMLRQILDSGKPFEIEKPGKEDSNDKEK
jgi:hypothetical protein